ncbi:ABC2-like protein [Artemisia annua]|uniref:ABC2-like protein n=1 Tax=Artemisia annua TaxID=35608 RepID=A0A2U1KWH5_ARTAN|nr:ABC2-like protein [Artemisia annua]PWA43344.1 ABC2-like protein [Artemisia annua]
MYASLYFPQITQLLHKLPRIILLMLKTNGCLRSVNNALIRRPSVKSFIIIGRVSSEARFSIMQVALSMLQFSTALAL